MKKLLFLFVLILFSANAYAFSINIDPPSVYTKAKPGETVKTKISVENTSEESVVLKVYLEDWQYLNDLSKKFLKLGSTPFSLKDAAKLYVKELRLQPKAKEDVLFEITSPTNKTGGLYGVVFFEAAPVLINQNSNVHLIGRIGSIIYHEIEGTQDYNFDLAFVNYDQEKSRTKLDFSFVNRSNIHLNLKGSLLILDKNHKVIERIETTLKALPKENQDIILYTSKKLGLGEKLCLFSLVYENSKFFTKEINFFVK
ncbi:MAG: hypothetical protein WC860_07575 [Candidatus Margulisiibacteriota bacterium]|jgi:hypothetical protein